MEQEVEVKWNYANRKWFVSKGYNFTNWGDIFYVKAKDLHDGSRYEIKFICDYCGDEVTQSFGVYQTGHNKYPKDACWHCGNKKTSEMKHQQYTEKMKNKVLDMAKQQKYEVIFNWDDYVNQNTRIKYICPKHGQQEMSCANFVQGYRCPKCGDESVSQKQRLSKEQVIQIIESVNGNKLLNPDDYIGNRPINLLVRCSCGNTFYTSIAKYHKKFRCSDCAKSESLGEKKIREFLEKNNIEFYPQYKFPDCKDIYCLPFDFYLKQYNKCIEFDGEQHSRPAFGEKSFRKTQKHDKMKNDYCISHNIELLRIPYTQYKDIDKILTKELLIT